MSMASGDVDYGEFAGFRGQDRDSGYFLVFGADVDFRGFIVARCF